MGPRPVGLWSWLLSFKWLRIAMALGGDGLLGADEVGGEALEPLDGIGMVECRVGDGDEAPLSIEGCHCQQHRVVVSESDQGGGPSVEENPVHVSDANDLVREWHDALFQDGCELQRVGLPGSWVASDPPGAIALVGSDMEERLAVLEVE